MKKYIAYLVGAICAVSLGFSAQASDKTVTFSNQVVPESAWVLTLAGGGATDTDNNQSVVGADLSLGRTGKWIFPNEYGLRQGVGYGDGDFVLSTRLYNDWTVLDYKKVDLFIGASVGLQYGDGQKPAWEIAPEVGLRFWVKDDAAVFGRAEFPWDLDGWNYKDTIRYVIGVQVKF